MCDWMIHWLCVCVSVWYTVCMYVCMCLYDTLIACTCLCDTLIVCICMSVWYTDCMYVYMYDSLIICVYIGPVCGARVRGDVHAVDSWSTLQSGHVAGRDHPHPRHVHCWGPQTPPCPHARIHCPRCWCKWNPQYRPLISIYVLPCLYIAIWIAKLHLISEMWITLRLKLISRLEKQQRKLYARNAHFYACTPCSFSISAIRAEKRGIIAVYTW